MLKTFQTLRKQLRLRLALRRERIERERQAEALQRLYAGHRRAAVEMAAGAGQ